MVELKYEIVEFHIETTKKNKAAKKIENKEIQRRKNATKKAEIN